MSVIAARVSMVVLLVALAGVDAWVRQEQKTVQARHQQQLTEDARQWGRDAVSRKLAFYEESVKRQRDQERQLEEAWGGPEEAAWKNPDLSISQMLENLGKASSPPDTIITVQVDRFTEFEMNLAMNQQTDKNELVQICLRILRRGSPYLRRIWFTKAGTVLAQLDEATIDSVADWATVPIADVEKLLTMPKAAESATEDARSANEPQGWVAKLQAKINEVSGEAKEPELNGDSKSLHDAQKAFKQALDERNQRLKSVLGKQDRAASLTDVHTPADLEMKLGLLRESEADLTGVRDFFLNQEVKYRSILEQAQLDPLLVNIEVRGIGEAQRRKRPYLEKLLAAIADRQRAANSLVTEMQSIWGSWSTSGNMIQFTSLEAQSTYLRVSTELSRTTDQVAAAMRASTD